MSTRNIFFSCTLFLVLAVLVGLFHHGQLSIFAPVLARISDQHGNLGLIGMSPAHHGNKPWRYQYSMLPGLSDRVALVTGANSGVGFWTALHLARKGAQVFVGCRSESKCAKALQDIKANYTEAKVEAVIFDVSSFASIRAFAESFLQQTQRLDILVLNAGVAFSSAKRSADGLDPIFATNHVGHQLLYMLLEARLVTTSERTGDARVVVVSSAGHYLSYDDGVALSRSELNARWDRQWSSKMVMDIKAYEQSKLANVLFAQEAARRMARSSVFVNSLHPGAVSTEIWNNTMHSMSTTVGGNRATTLFAPFLRYFMESMWTPEEGALTQVYLAASTDVLERDLRGRYFHPQAVETQPCRRFTHNLTLQRALWNFTEELIAGRG